MKQLSIINLLLSFIALMFFWLVMSGIYKPMQITYGVISAIVVIAVNYRLKSYKFFDDEMDNLSQLRFIRAPWYVIWLLYQMIMAGFQVASVILIPNKHVETYILKFKVDLPSAHAKMILGNSITLTPGTLTIDIKGDDYIVHALTPASFEGIVNDSMPRQVLKLFENTDRQVISDIQILNSEEQIADR